MLVTGAYALGAVPWGLVLGRMLHQTDLRDHGSGSTGTTNAYRILGGRASVAVLILDFSKGVLPVILALWLGAGDWTVGLVAVAATVGHCWSVFIGFGGGKGVATGAGAAVALWPWIALLALAMLAVFAVTRIVSLASLSGAVLGAMLAVVAGFAGWIPWATSWSLVAIAAVIIVRHRENIGRLRAGTERRLTKPPNPKVAA